MFGILLTTAPVLLVLIGYALRVWRLSAFSITYDELDSILFADMRVRDLFAALATYEPHPPFYYLFLHGWLNLAGRSDFALRFPSVTFGTLAVATAYSAGRCIGGRAVGLAAMAILAVSQLSIAYSQDGRMYAALQAFVALYLAGLLLHLRRPTQRSVVVLAIAGLLAAYTHYHGLLVVALGALAIV
ncbi:MAG TPA: glycosyltransferase family 39 protein, partial [Chloroflexota bacterium]|nr:glycosyltransferase family 39 protein [Chloroflexota bacterium]